MALADARLTIQQYDAIHVVKLVSEVVPNGGIHAEANCDDLVDDRAFRLRLRCARAKLCDDIASKRRDGTPALPVRVVLGQERSASGLHVLAGRTLRADTTHSGPGRHHALQLLEPVEHNDEA